MNIGWYFNRLKAMSIPEVMWRLDQKRIQNSEKKKYADKKITVISHIFNPQLNSLRVKADLLGLNYENMTGNSDITLSLFHAFDYNRYEKDWSAGFQTDEKWPRQFSYALEYKQKDEIGDARTNWELNRHFQFVNIAKCYYLTEDEQYLKKFESLFYDWNENNYFLEGISWTSVMEVGIRLSSWIYSYCILSRCKDVSEELLTHLNIGIINMADYVYQHYSRFSSANNHLIVEAYSFGLVGILTGYNVWKDTAIEIFSNEFYRQNYRDGINKELSLHYQAFYMEAVALFVRAMQCNHMQMPKDWNGILVNMSRYLSQCVAKHGEIVEFGDDDEGKILNIGNLQTSEYYQYILQLMGLVLEERYSDYSQTSENIKWLYTEQVIQKNLEKLQYDNTKSVCYLEGGNSILKSQDQNITIGIDHAELGFGNIAAHGHADALSFQMYVKGVPLFVDPGTYIYHIDRKERDAFRKTINHNTLSLDGNDQSKMLGSFLWGERAEVTLLKHQLDENRDYIVASHDGYSPLVHERSFLFDKHQLLIIEDDVKEPNSGNNETEYITYVLGDQIIIKNQEKDSVTLEHDLFTATLKVEADLGVNIVATQVEYSREYGSKKMVDAIRIHGPLQRVKTTIEIHYN